MDETERSDATHAWKSMESSGSRVYKKPSVIRRLIGCPWERENYRRVALGPATNLH